VNWVGISQKQFPDKHPEDENNIIRKNRKESFSRKIKERNQKKQKADSH
jgi:hypothetical protein